LLSNANLYRYTAGEEELFLLGTVSFILLVFEQMIIGRAGTWGWHCSPRYLAFKTRFN
jgi:hypothetical protein